MFKRIEKKREQIKKKKKKKKKKKNLQNFLILINLSHKEQENEIKSSLFKYKKKP